MRIIIFFCLISFVFACQNETSTTEVTESEVAEELQPTVSIKDVPKVDACKYLERGAMSKILQWNHAGVQENLVESAANGKQSRCQFTHKEQSLQFRIAWKSESDTTEYALIKKYADYLEKGNEGVNYRVLKADAQTQTLFGIGKSTETQHSYIVHKRYGDEVDIEMVLTTKRNAAAEFRTKLLQLSEAINLFPIQVN